MTTFDLAEVQGFAADLNTGMDRCGNGEGMGHFTLDEILESYAQICRDFCDQIRRWADAVFTGRSKFDPEVERILREEGSRLYNRALEILEVGRQRAALSSPPYESPVALHFSALGS